MTPSEVGAILLRPEDENGLSARHYELLEALKRAQKGDSDPRLTTDEINYYAGIPEECAPRMMADLLATGHVNYVEFVDNLGSMQVCFFIEPEPEAA